MPSNTLPYIKETDDGRRKISTEQRQEIKEYYKSFNSQRKTAKHFNISRRLVVFVLFPERLAALQQHNKKIQHHKIYYNTQKQKIYMQRHRLKKKIHNLTTDKSHKKTTQQFQDQYNQLGLLLKKRL